MSFKDNIWTADLPGIGQVFYKNQGIKYLLRDIDVLTKCSCVRPLTDKIAKTALNRFIGIVNKSKCKPNKLYVDPVKEFINSPMQKDLDDNDIFIYSNCNEDTSVGAEKFTKSLKGKNLKK